MLMLTIVNYIYIVHYSCSLNSIEINLVNYSCFGSSSLLIFKFSNDKMSSFSPQPAFEKKVHKIQERFGYRYSE